MIAANLAGSDLVFVAVQSNYVDNSLMKELETSGFIKNLYRK